jgi:hypothetical protein
MDYAPFFFVLTDSGTPVRLCYGFMQMKKLTQVTHPRRSWMKMIETLYDLWTESQKPRSRTAVGQRFTQLGVQDVIKKHIIDNKYDNAAKENGATSAKIEFVEKVKFLNLISSDQEFFFNPYFKTKGEQS